MTSNKGLEFHWTAQENADLRWLFQVLRTSRRPATAPAFPMASRAILQEIVTASEELLSRSYASQLHQIPVTSYPEQLVT